MSTLKLADWSSDRYYFEFEPSTCRFTRTRLTQPRSSMLGLVGHAQHLRVGWRAKVLVAVYAHGGRMQLSVGRSTWPLYADGLSIVHREGTFTSELTIRADPGESIRIRYVHADNLLRIIDSTYDQLDFELMNLPANLEGYTETPEADLLALWDGTAGPRAGAGSAPGDPGSDGGKAQHLG